jgi:5-methyltetrahydrofolate--homocysteine methyltransferase
MPAEAIVDCYEPLLGASRYYADAFPTLWINFGPGIGSGFLGAEVHSVVEPSETVWFTPPGDVPVPLDKIDGRHDPNNPWYRRVRAVTSAFAERYGGDLQVSMSDLGGNMDILAAFRTTQQLLVDVIEQPEAVERALNSITAAWLRYYDEIDALIRPPCRGTSCWTPIWSTGTCYMLQSDFSYMISPKMFERFVVPDLTACCDHLDHAFYHLDGKGEIPHLDHLLSIERLRGIQWISGDGQPSPDQWLGLLKRIRDGGKLCQVFVRPEGALHIVRHLGGKGFLLVIQHEREEFTHPEEAATFLKVLAEDDISLRRSVLR